MASRRFPLRLSSQSPASSESGAGDKLINVIIEDEFYETDIFVGDEINLQNFDVTIVFEDKTTKTFKLGDVYRNKLDTSSVGKKTFTITYLDEDFVINYEVKEVYAVSGRVKQDNIVVYYGEDDCLDDVPFNILYSNGKEETLNLSVAEVEIKWSGEFGDESFATACYAGIEFSFSCRVVLREIKDNHVYELIDETGLFAEQRYIMIAGGSATIFHEDNEHFISDLNTDVTYVGSGKYQSTIIASEKIMTVEIYAYKDKVIMKEKQV